MTKGRFFLVLPLFLVLVLGCAPKTNAPANVSGKVTYKGTPLKGGTIGFFSPSAGGFNTATISPDGTYSGTALPIGELIVTVETESVNKNKKTETYGGAKAPKGQEMSPVPEGAAQDSGVEYVKIPEKYADKDRSGLKVTLTAGSQTHDIDLTD